MSKHTEQNAEQPFSLREGIIPIPAPLKLEEISRELRVDLWNYFYTVFQKNKDRSLYTGTISYDLLNKTLIPIFTVYFGDRMDVLSKECSNDTKSLVNRSERIFLNSVDKIFVCPYHSVLDFLEICSNGFPIFNPAKIAKIFDKHKAAYHFHHYKTINRWNFIPTTSEANLLAVKRCLENIEEGGQDVAIKHLSDASNAFKNNEFADVVSKSNNAVEAIATNMTGKKTLSDAINVLRIEKTIHPTLLTAFDKISGYANDTARHGKVPKEGDPEIDQDEALLIFGANAAIASFLVAKSKKGDER